MQPRHVSLCYCILLTHFHYEQALNLYENVSHLSVFSFFIHDFLISYLVPPLCSNRGKGGAIAQLQAVAKIIEPTKKKKTTTGNVLKDVPLNPMAPAEKGCKIFIFFVIIPDVVITDCDP